jgi:hypothetical protein
MDVTTGAVYVSDDEGRTWTLASAPQVPAPPASMIVSSRNVLNPDGTSVVNLSIEVTP